MKTIEIKKIQELYKWYGVNSEGQTVNGELKRGNLSNRLNSDFSNIYGRPLLNSFSSTAVEKKGHQTMTV